MNVQFRWGAHALVVLVVALLGALLTFVPAGNAAGTQPSATATAEPSASAEQLARPRYSPPKGPIFNNPLGSAEAQYRVLNQVQDAIKHARRRSTIKVMSWNIMSRSVVTTLLNAQKRGVRIRALMDHSNLADIPNPYFKRLRRGFVAQNQNLRRENWSYARTCKRSCRGRGGQAHGKFYLFSHTGTARNVFMEGSANLTAASATNQWNDLFTFVGDIPLYSFAGSVFDQMWRDRPVRAAFVKKKTANGTLYFSPYRGPNFNGDPIQRLLDNVRCKGALNVGNRRTIIRVAPDVIRNERGLRAARRLKQLWNQGCDVKIAYTILGRDSHDVLRCSSGRGPVPLRHLVQDFNGDRQFDNYFHLKAISINGVVGRNRRAHVLMNGSSNLSGMASASDENIMIMRKPGATLAYQRFITHWFDNPPRSARPLPLRPGAAPVDPYAHVDMD
jgi:phosphatidylserine/phosphatidylglycerophosphate/cardiolipin synthase-like enzyme